MICNPSNYQDVNKYFGQTYVVIPEYDPHKVLLLWKADRDYIYFKDTTTNEEGGLSFKDQESYTLTFHLPRKQAFQSGPHALLLQRIPARMWKKGISPENTVIFAYGASGTFAKTSLQVEYLNSMLKGLEPPKNILEIDWEKFSSVALSNRFVIAKSGGLFADNFRVGSINFKDKQAMVLAPFKPHVKSFLPNDLKVYYG